MDVITGLSFWNDDTHPIFGFLRAGGKVLTLIEVPEYNSTSVNF